MTGSTKSATSSHAGHQIGAQMRGQRTPVLLDEVLHQRPAHRLRHRALDLTLDLLRVDRLAHIVHTHQALDRTQPVSASTSTSATCAQ